LCHLLLPEVLGLPLWLVASTSSNRSSRRRSLRSMKVSTRTNCCLKPLRASVCAGRSRPSYVVCQHVWLDSEADANKIQRRLAGIMMYSIISRLFAFRRLTPLTSALSVGVSIHGTGILGCSLFVLQRTCRAKASRSVREPKSCIVVEGINHA
jgi:hypothetical protein